MVIQSINPATGEVVASYPEMMLADVRAAVDRAHNAFLEWRGTGFKGRATVMRKAARLLRARDLEYARLMAVEMGKPVRAGIAEIHKCALACEFYAENAQTFLALEPVDTEYRKSFIAFQPLGVILGVMPWNFPFWQAFRFLAPTLMAGNGAVLKHASNVPGCAQAIEKIFSDAESPESLVRNLMIGSQRVDAAIENPLVRAVSLTGSAQAGRAVASKAGSVLKKTVLELGGSDPYVVLEDADVEQAAEICAKGRLMNSGQSCVAAKRFIVVEKIHDAFLKLFVRHMAEVRIGNPLDEHTEMGPLARHDLRNTLHKQVMDSVAKGAKCVLGGAIPKQQGAYYPPTVLIDVKKGMPAFDEETFGPVAAVVRAASETEAIALANDSVFGLGGGVMTSDWQRGERIAVEEIESGMVFVNDHVRSDQRLPFGGIKESGYGRELSAYGIKEFVNIKTIALA